MQKRERERLKSVVYQAYMTAVAKGDKTAEKIYEDLGEQFHRPSDTIKKWVIKVRKQREDVQVRLKKLEATTSEQNEKTRLIASGDYYLNWETGEPIKTKHIGCTAKIGGKTVLF